MAGEILNGKALAEDLKDEVAERVEELGFQPTLSSILVGKDPTLKLYMNLQTQACKEVGIKPKKILFDRSVSQSHLLNRINSLNHDDDINGIIVQLPLPSHIKTSQVLQEIDVSKDVDGFTPRNLGKLVQGNEVIIPATPKGILKLLESINLEFEGKEIVIVNHSVVVGKPLSLLCLNRNATVSVCHKYTKNLKNYTLKADVLITATGVQGLIKPEMVKEDAIVIDAGISRTDEGVVGDVEFDQVRQKASYITPVPGGVGPMTIACLLENIVKACRLQMP